MMLRNRRVLTGLVAGALSAGAVVLVGLADGPSAAKADAGTSLTTPIAPVAEAQRGGSVRNRIGWTHAKQRLQADMPMGRGVAVGQVESVFRGGYLADTKHKHLPGTGIIAESGKSKHSGHATMVATHIAGPQSAGQGVRAIHAWNVSDWMGAGFLKAGSAENPRADHPARVFNHSWIAPKASAAPVVLRRIDYLVDTRDVLVVCGVNNGAGAIPDLLASAYNVISVGMRNGKHSDGLTTTEGPGRCKPELVAPGNKTSWSTGVVTGVCAALLEQADRMIEADPQDEEGKPGRNHDAARSEVIKAVLFAGADRGAGWAPSEGEPLDRKLGAGVVDIDRALVVLNGGHAAPDEPTKQRYGWSFATIGPGNVRAYTFAVDVEQGETGVALVWHRRVLGGTANLVNKDTGESRKIWNLAQFMPDLNLGLVRTDADGNEALVATSTSKVDNVELIHLPKLDPGVYTLRIARSKDDAEQLWDYAVAWRIEAKAASE